MGDELQKVMGFGTFGSSREKTPRGSKKARSFDYAKLFEESMKLARERNKHEEEGEPRVFKKKFQKELLVRLTRGQALNDL